MSSDNASSVVTYTSISSDSDGPSWGISLMNVSELPEMDPYEEVAQQRQAPPLSHAYVPDPMEMDEHVPVYVLELEHPEYHIPSDDDMWSMEEDSIDYPDEPEDDDQDPEEDLSKEHEPEDDDEDLEEDPSEEHEPKDEDTKEGEPSEGFDETEPFEEDETVALIDAFAAGSPLFLLPPTSPAYDQAPLGHRKAMICIRDDIPEEDMPPQTRFILTAPLLRCDVAESSAAAARPPRPYLDDASPTAESPGHIVDSESMEEDSIDYPDKPEDDDEDPEEDLEEDHTDYPADGEDGDDEPSDDDDDDDEDKDPTKDEEEEEHLDSADFSAVPVVDPVPSAGDTKAFETYESAPTPRSPQTSPFFSDTSP
ncbi:hypothetical protein Tco_0885225 [Tanacetum coccineum]